MKRFATVSIVATSALFILGCGGLSSADFGDFVPVDGAPIEAEPEDAPEDEPEDEPEDAPEDAPEDEGEAEGDEPEDGVEEPVEAPEPEPVDDGTAVAPEPAPAPKPAPAGANVAVKGDGKVVLVGGGARYPVPGKVPPGTYDIEVSFNGAKAVTSGKVKVGANGATVQCKASMGLCRSQ